jgi:hypothetical protein
MKSLKWDVAHVEHTLALWSCVDQGSVTLILCTQMPLANPDRQGIIWLCSSNTRVLAGVFNPQCDVLKASHIPGRYSTTLMDITAYIPRASRAILMPPSSGTGSTIDPASTDPAGHTVFGAVPFVAV